jgi:hypothetical protein
MLCLLKVLADRAAVLALFGNVVVGQNVKLASTTLGFFDRVATPDELPLSKDCMPKAQAVVRPRPPLGKDCVPKAQAVVRPRLPPCRQRLCAQGPGCSQASTSSLQRLCEDCVLKAQVVVRPRLRLQQQLCLLGRSFLRRHHKLVDVTSVTTKRDGDTAQERRGTCSAFV